MLTKEQAINKVLSTMHLRRPQVEAIKAFHDVLNRTEEPLFEMTQFQVCQLFREQYPMWNYSDNVTEFTFQLATGVGKTRLIGALIAYLFLSGNSKHFMIISPRAEIIRKFNAVSQPEHKDYLFVDPNFISCPRLMSSESSLDGPSFFDEIFTGPQLWIMTPQAFTANEAKIKKRGEYEDCSLVEFLQKKNDLIVFFDESHHLGYDSNTTSIWRTEIQALNPKMIIGTTASVDDYSKTNVIYSYDLCKCLNERLYTKLVQIIPDKKDDMMNDDDYDAIVLRFGWQQLEYKQKVLDDYVKANNLPTKVKAVMLVACQDIKHAEQVTDWFRKFLGNKLAVLLVHSKMKESDFLPSLKNIEDPNTPIKVVVNVSKLNEGWDVSNIYVITPLRAMASSTLVTQIMGRGLRLPFGSQTGNEDVDTLDVLCFGKETMQEICDKLINSGYGVNNNGITVTNPPERKDIPTREFIPTKKFPLKVCGKTSCITIPMFKLSRPLLDINQISLPPLKPDSLHSFFISDPRTIKKLNGQLSFDRDAFLKLVSSEIIKQCTYLSFEKHYKSIFILINDFLNSCGYSEDAIPLEPEKVILHIKKCLDTLSRQTKAKYISLSEVHNIDLSNYQINVPETLEEPIDATSFDIRKWSTRMHKGLPFSGWVRSLFESIPFDQANELKIAKIIDRSAEVTWWFRNLPGLITLPTPSGNYSPDFAIFIETDTLSILLEIKGDIYYGKEDDDATIKANAAREWCKAQSLASGKKWQYWFLLDSDADICNSFDDIKNNSDIS